MSNSDIVLAPLRRGEEAIEKRLAETIESTRKATYKVRAVTPDGKPAAGAKIKVRQIAHDFRFGANIFLLDEFENERKNSLYRELFPRAFNQATLPFYWRELEPVRGKPRFEKSSPRVYRRPPPDLCVEFCQENGIMPKGHCLNYFEFIPDWIPLDRAEERSLLAKRMREIGERYADSIPCFEVTNEFLARGPMNNSYRKFPAANDKDIIEWSFAEARRHFPKNELVINETHCYIFPDQFWVGAQSAYYMQIERALSRGAPIDAIGMQFHMFHYRPEGEITHTPMYCDPERLFGVFDQYSDFGLPLQITEITIPAYSESAEDEATQAELIRRLFRLWFATPAIECITYWNLVDGYTYGTPQGDMSGGENIFYGGLLRFDMTPKPAFEVIRELFSREWHTECELAADSNGEATFRGFKGDYELAADSAICTIEKL